jgi:hypothetical protein
MGLLSFYRTQGNWGNIHKTEYTNRHLISLLIQVGKLLLKGIVSRDIDGLFTILSYSLDVGPLPLGILFFNFMFSYFKININVGAVLIQTAPAFPEKMAQFV